MGQVRQQLGACRVMAPGVRGSGRGRGKPRGASVGAALARACKHWLATVLREALHAHQTQGGAREFRTVERREWQPPSAVGARCRRHHGEVSGSPPWTYLKATTRSGALLAARRTLPPVHLTGWRCSSISVRVGRINDADARLGAPALRPVAVARYSACTNAQGVARSE